MLSTRESAHVALLIREKQLEEERLQDVELLLKNLFYREEATLKIIVDCLYDVGSANLINQRFHRRSLNRLMKWIARLTKPGFHFLAVRWVKKNAPKHITHWLHSQVRFR
jgi:hypothetical protein